MRVTHVTSIPNIRLSRMGQLALTVAAAPTPAPARRWE